ncbi:hypothetical protein Pmar_PMAR028250 [Perkinsus marinus ATCC 50983]|uniref:Uncharacterized protein n=1 Tax=Perkinsus marinus (strain ATCC 50983 / TXsc) TaxID=423536 RepID=C5LBD3_PERM5|nr:hypothetical protein Pmar_PMAR028250 [Perkinsus marinus ATCC 50983]EER06061.1 hypothetical protein Pmar_PMAR028250 [Perkinsus marinus ATCC 50983]|eukprot:XP_002774245.1 hypothetical protein Pmar_PMAR028250 [Perkinsus marinus ATCC 50983]
MCCQHPIDCVEFEPTTACHVCTACGEVISDVSTCEGFVAGRDNGHDEFQKEGAEFINLSSSPGNEPTRGSKVVRGLKTVFASCEPFGSAPHGPGEAFIDRHERDLQQAATQHGIDVEMGEQWQRLLDVTKFFADRRYSYNEKRNRYYFGSPQNIKISVHGICSFVARELGCESPNHRERYIDGVNMSSRKLAMAVRRIGWDIRKYAKESGDLAVGPTFAERKQAVDTAPVVKRVAEALDRVQKRPRSD